MSYKFRCVCVHPGAGRHPDGSRAKQWFHLLSLFPLSRCWLCHTASQLCALSHIRPGEMEKSSLGCSGNTSRVTTHCWVTSAHAAVATHKEALQGGNTLYALADVDLR